MTNATCIRFLFKTEEKGTSIPKRSSSTQDKNLLMSPFLTANLIHPIDQIVIACLT